MRFILNIAVLFFACSFELDAQSFFAKGKIVDEATGEPLSFASLLIKGTSAGTQCDEKGNFSVACKTLPATLIIYKIGYQTKEVPVDGEKAELLVKMKSKALQLTEVEVSSSRTEILQEKNQTEYLAFDFYDNLIIALSNKGAFRNVIQMISETGELIRERPAPKGVETIFRDCFGNIQLLSKDSSYQVFFNYEDIILQKPFPIDQFRQFLEPCQCSYGDFIYIKNSRCKSLQNEYVCIDRFDPKNRNVMAVVADSSAIRYFNQRYDINYFLAKRRQGGQYQTSADEILKHIDEFREQIPLSDQERFRLQPIQSAIVHFDTTLFIMDFFNKTTLTYSTPNTLLHRASLDSTNHLKPELLVDQDLKKVYLRQERKGESILYQYDFKSQSLARNGIPIEKFYFISNLRIRNGYLYFLYRDRIDQKNKKIYKHLL